MSTKQQRLASAMAAINARESAKRPKPVEKPKKVKAAPVVEAVVEEPVEIVDEFDAIGEGDQ